MSDSVLAPSTVYLLGIVNCTHGIDVVMLVVDLSDHYAIWLSFCSYPTEWQKYKKPLAVS